MLCPNIQYWERAPAVSDKLVYKEGAWSCDNVFAQQFNKQENNINKLTY